MKKNSVLYLVTVGLIAFMVYKYVSSQSRTTTVTFPNQDSSTSTSNPNAPPVINEKPDNSQKTLYFNNLRYEV